MISIDIDLSTVNQTEYILSFCPLSTLEILTRILLNGWYNTRSTNDRYLLLMITFSRLC